MIGKIVCGYRLNLQDVILTGWHVIYKETRELKLMQNSHGGFDFIIIYYRNILSSGINAIGQAVSYIQI